MDELKNFKNKVAQYQETLENTINYREQWISSLREDLITQLSDSMDTVPLDGRIDIKEDVVNLEAVVLSLGKTHSGIYEELEGEMKHQFVRNNGMLVYQQLFNGKIMVIIVYPSIESLGEPKPSKMVAIYRPDELKPPFIIRHLEEFIKEMTLWEDYDDDDQKVTPKIGFSMNYEDLDD